MAARRSGGRGRRRGFVQRNEHFWSGQAVNQAATAIGTTSTVDLVAPVDWVARLGQASAVLVRIRGSFAFTLTGAGEIGALFAAIMVIDEDEASPNPSVASTLINEDILWTYCGGLHAPATGAARYPVSVEFDVKAKRKLKVQDEVRLIIRNEGNSGELSMMSRALVVVR